MNKEEHVVAAARSRIAVRCLIAVALGALAIAFACGSARAAVPPTPTNVTAFPADGSAGVTFAAPAQKAGSPVTYTVTSTPANVQQTGDASPIVVHGLTNGTAYQFTVHATNTDGDSAESSVSNFVIPVDESGSVIGLSSKGAFALIWPWSSCSRWSRGPSCSTTA